MNYEDLKTPKELFEFMADNFSYGYIGKNGQHYSKNDPSFGEDWIEQYQLQSPEELLKSKVGVCWDFSELAKDWLNKNDFKVKSFFLTWENHERTASYPTHSIEIFEKNDKFYWSDLGFKERPDILINNTLEDAKEQVKKLQIEIVKQYHNGNDEDIQHLMIVPVTKANKPKYGSNPTEYVKTILNDYKG